MHETELQMMTFIVTRMRNTSRKAYAIVEVNPLTFDFGDSAISFDMAKRKVESEFVGKWNEPVRVCTYEEIAKDLWASDAEKEAAGSIFLSLCLKQDPPESRGICNLS